MANFVAHLHNHLYYSFKDCSADPKKSLQKAEALGYKGYAITDHGSIAGWVAADMASKKLNIKVIFGAELYEASRKVSDKEGYLDQESFHSVFLAKNEKGLEAIRKLTTFSLKLANKYYVQRYDIDYLKDNAELFRGNVIWMSACLSGRVAKLLNADREDEALDYVKTMEDVFGSENVFIELQNHGIHHQILTTKKLIEFAKKHGFNMVATNDVHYVNKEEYIAREIMLARDNGELLEDRRNEGKIYPSEMYIKTPAEMELLFKGVPQAIENTEKIFNMIDKMSLAGKDWHFPHFPIPEGHTDKSYLEEMVWKDLENKYPLDGLEEDEVKVIKDRVRSEIDVIDITSACAYMLIDADYKKFAKENGIRIGPGRGSACGSLVADVLDITNVNPLKYGLIMERFINPERISMPDIDSDYQDDRRSEVISYVVEKYGADRVAMIMTVGTMAAKVSIRDVGAVLDIDSKLVDTVAKMIPVVPGITITLALEENSKLKEMYEKDSIVKELIDHALMVEGIARQSGVHAAGVIISDAPLEKYGALMEVEGSDIPVFMADMKAVEHLKLLKMDFLGLKTLSVIDECIKTVFKNHGRLIDLDKIDMDDPEVYKFISTGKTSGIFQLESGGMQSLMKNLQPTSLEDIIAGISMYRPGPIEKIPLFLENKMNPNKIVYPEDAKSLLKPILDVTYGVMVYQEQVMKVVRDLAGYTFGRSDIVRKAMSKKTMDVLQKERAVFIFGEEQCNACSGTGKDIEGKKCPICTGDKVLPRQLPCVHCEIDPETEKNLGCDHCNHTGYVKTDTNGVETVSGCAGKDISFATADGIFDDMIEFAKYAFNKSHATAYAIIAYQTAYLRYYYGVEYMTAYLNSLMKVREKLKAFIGAVRKMGFEIKRPDVNTSEDKFTCKDGLIYMGLTALENIGDSIKSLIEERTNNGLYKDIYDFINRAPVAKSELEALAKSGALDSLNVYRSQILHNTKKLIDYSRKEKAIKESGQFSLFSMDAFKDEESFKFEFPNILEYPKMTLFNMEREISGFYLSGHPLDLKEYKDHAKKSNISTVDEFEEDDHRKKVKIVGVVTFDEKKEGIRLAKSGKFYGVFNIEDQYSSIKVMLFKEKVDDFKHLVHNGTIIEVIGSLMVDVKEFENAETGEIVQTSDVKIFAEKLIQVNAAQQNTKKVYLKINSKTMPLLNVIKETIGKFPGNDEVIIIDEDTKKGLRGLKVGYSAVFEKEMKKILTDKDIAVR